jgi:uncharacterized membrane protein YkoI
MKSLKVVLAGVFACTLFAFTTTSVEKVPQKVKDAFTQKFPDAKSVKWDKESQNEWEAAFKMKRMKYSANFTNDGMWKETEHEIEEAQVPSNIKKSLMEKFKGYTIEESEISETPQGMVYEFEIKKKETEMEVALDASGKVVSTEDHDKEDKD